MTIGSVDAQVETTQLKESFYADTKRLDEVKRNKDDPESLKIVAKEFEAIFIQMMLKSMREAQKSMKSEFFSDFSTDQYEQMYDQQLSLSLSENGGLGLADAIVKQMSPYMNTPNKNSEQSGISIDVKSIDNNKLAINKLESAKKMLVKFSENQLKKGDLKEENISFLKQQLSKIENKKESLIGQKGPDYNDTSDFVKNVWPGATSAAKKLKIDPKILVAQAALETGWGKKVIQDTDGNSSNNYFGIKVESKWKGDKILIPTMEFEDNVFNQVKAEFKAYPSLHEGFNDYFNTLSNNERYKNAVEAEDAKGFLEGLQNAGYATDPEYANKIMQIYNGSTLNGIVKSLKLMA